MIGLGLLAGGIGTLTERGGERRARRQERRVNRIAERNPERAARVDARLSERNETLNQIGDPVRDFWDDATGVTAMEEATAAQEEGRRNALGELDPYTSAGQRGLGAMQDLLGANGAEAQAAAYDMIQNSPGFMEMVQQGENAMLQNASATGGLRGGNTQGALAQFRPQMLQQAIQQQLGGYQGLAGMGMNAASQAAGIHSGIGDVGAAGHLGAYEAQRGALGDIFGFGKDMAELYAMTQGGG